MEWTMVVNGWLGPLMALGAIGTGATLLLGEFLWNRTFGDD
ncbi:MAG: hypothetical protein AAGJ81_12470 [Verrucomicrobiota bacterium]